MRVGVARRGGGGAGPQGGGGGGGGGVGGGGGGGGSAAERVPTFLDFTCAANSAPVPAMTSGFAALHSLPQHVMTATCPTYCSFRLPCP